MCDIHSQGVIGRARRSAGADGVDHLGENNQRLSPFQADTSGLRLYNTWVSNTSVAQGHHSQPSAVTPATNHFLESGHSVYSQHSLQRSESRSRIQDIAAVSRLPVARTKIANLVGQSS